MNGPAASDGGSLFQGPSGFLGSVPDVAQCFTHPVFRGRYVDIELRIGGTA